MRELRETLAFLVRRQTRLSRGVRGILIEPASRSRRFSPPWLRPLPKTFSRRCSATVKSSHHSTGHQFHGTRPTATGEPHLTSRRGFPPPIGARSFNTTGRKHQVLSFVVIPTNATFTTCCPKARQFATGAIVGEDAQAWSGVAMVGRKAEWPGWTPTESEKRRLGPLPNYVEGGARNPMGARALYAFSGGQDTLYRVHGTNHPDGSDMRFRRAASG